MILVPPEVGDVARTTAALASAQDHQGATERAHGLLRCFGVCLKQAIGRIECVFHGRSLSQASPAQSSKNTRNVASPVLARRPATKMPDIAPPSPRLKTRSSVTAGSS